MMAFPLTTMVLCLIAIALLLIPLLRGDCALCRDGQCQTGPDTTDPDDPADANLRIYRQQVTELAAERDAGRIDPTRYREIQAELARDLLSQPSAPAEPAAPVGGGRRWAVAGLLAVLVPTVGLATYVHTGAGNEGLQASAARAHPDQSPAEVVQASLATLQAHLERHPEDSDNWLLLGRTLTALGKTEQALESYRAALRHGQDDHPELLARYADLLAGSRDGRLRGDPERLVRRALDIDPDHRLALWLAGSAALERGDAAVARRHWERLLALLPAESDDAGQIRENLRALDGPRG
ncbi:c-type cytochrome biogenesis protein CcmI [Alkalilimnicola ehrlichii]|uniref:c-type cytochrome biogenesis protein CcmI n=1 Tax=Alkalilimnicola ehrlichii TaxID=351052 RepID=UPI003BA233B1